MTANALAKSYLFYATWRGEADVVILSAIAASTFIDVGYIIGQAGLDGLVRYAAILFIHKNIDATKVQPPVVGPEDD